MAQFHASSPQAEPLACHNANVQAVGWKLDKFPADVTGARENERVVDQRPRHPMVRSARCDLDAHVEWVLLQGATQP